jgi:hypothetical protein
LRTEDILFIAGAACLVALLFTIVFSQDLTHVSLAEHDAQLELFLEGHPESYKGALNKNAHLSMYQQWSGHHGEYDPLWKTQLLAQYRRTNTRGSSVLAEQAPAEVLFVEASTKDLDEKDDQ